MRIVILEAAEKSARSLQKRLQDEGFVVEYYLDGIEGEDQIMLNRDLIDLVISEIFLSKKDGLTICRSLRNEHINIPILILSAKDTVNDKITGLNSGADDYLTKPFSYDELLARIKALLRRPSVALPSELKTGNLTLNTLNRKITYQDKEIILTLKEFMLLEYLMRHRNQVLTREQILENLWDINFDSFSNVVDVHIKNLRKKLDAYIQTDILETIRGIGYRIKG